MEKVIIFGTGKHWTNHKRMLRDVEIIAFTAKDQIIRQLLEMHIEAEK